MSCGDSCGRDTSSCGTILLHCRKPLCYSCSNQYIPVCHSGYPQQSCVNLGSNQTCGFSCDNLSYSDLCNSQPCCGTKSSFSSHCSDSCKEQPCCGVKYSCTQPLCDTCGNQSRCVVRYGCQQSCPDSCSKQYCGDTKICGSTSSYSIPYCGQAFGKSCCPSVKSSCETQSIGYCAKKC